MKKILFLLFGLACLTACSDDVVESISSQSTRMNTEMLYLTVKIIDVGSLTRAEEGTPAYQYGTADEYAVDKAYFYFYDEDGYFVSRGEAWNSGKATNNETSNVEFESETIVVLKGLTSVGSPKYMITVLNEPAGFESSPYYEPAGFESSPYYEPAGTLKEFQTKLASESTNGINNDNGNFVMSTSSYWAEDGATSENDSRYPYYFVTEIPESAFKEEPVSNLSPSDAVQVYVERLAAKVEVDVDMTEPIAETITEADGTTHTVYALEENIIESEDGIGSLQDIYIEFQGWALNATTRQSYIVKNIESTDVWTNPTSGGNLGFTWNNPGDCRSFWGMSYNYGIDADYPTSSNGNTDEDESSSDENDWLNPYLKYTSLNGELNEFGSAAYCAENTNTVGEDGILQSSYSSAITSVLLRARAWHVDSDTKVASPITLVRYFGELYTDSAFLYVVAQELDVYEEGTFYYGDLGETATSIDDVKPFDGRFLTIINQGNGCIGIAINEEVLDGYAWYQYNSIRGSLDPITDDFFFIMFTEMETSCDEFNAYWSLTGEGGETINEYANGLMYYNIPIEHLNESNKIDGAYDGLLEANYGIVRNHWYSLTINSLSHLGTGIVNDSEVIVPTQDDTSYIRAEISILPWKLIENTVIF